MKFLIDSTFKEYNEKIPNNKIYREYKNNKDIEKKYVFYKMVANSIGIDVDSSSTVINSFRDNYNFLGTFETKNQGNQKCKYELINSTNINNKLKYRGETIINPISVIEHFYDLETKAKLCLLLSNDEDKIKEFDKIRKEKSEMYELLIKHIELCYSYGNFYPIPYDGEHSLNTFKGRLLQDNTIKDSMYEYLKLVKNYFESEENSSSNSDKLFDYYKEYFYNVVGENGKPSFKKFVDENHLKMFVDAKNDYEPISFYNGDITEYIKNINDVLEERYNELTDKKDSNN